MTAAYHIGVKTFLNNSAGTGFDHGLPRYRRSTLGTVVKFGFDPLGLFGGEQA